MTLPELGKPFIGRTTKLDQLCAMLQSRAKTLVTVTGFGGYGKTTLALEAARRVETQFEHGAVFIPLAAITDDRIVAPQIARSLGLAETSSGGNIEHELVAHLREKELLLLLDNFEQILGAKSLVETLLTACPNLVVLVTSRRTLNLGRETTFKLDPMTLPPVDRDLNLNAVSGNEAVLLFAARAKAVRPEFELTEQNAADIAAICRTMEGIPLAIELAAARMRAIGPRELLRVLTPRLGLTVGGPENQDPRHQALSTMIAWSYELLTESEQRLFRALSVFVDGFTVDAVITVSAHANAASNRTQGSRSVSDAQRTVLDLSELAASHLIRFHELADGSSRYDMLETIIEFGQIELHECGEIEAASAAHAAHFFDFALRSEQAIRSGDAPEWMGTLERELGNLRAALRWWIERNYDPKQRALQLCNALWSFWRLRGSWIEAIEWLETSIAAAGNQPSLQLAIAWLNLGNSVFDDQRRAQACYESCLHLFEELEDAAGIGIAIGSLAMLAELMGEYARGKELIGRALERLRALSQDARASIAQTLIIAADLEINSGQPALARPLLDETLMLWPGARDEQYVAVALWRLGRVERLLGNYDNAIDFLEQALAALKRRGDLNLEYMARCELGKVLLATEQFRAAFDAFSASIAIARELKIVDGTVFSALEGASRLQFSQGRDAEGVKIIAAVERMREERATPLPSVERAELDRAVKAAKRRLKTKFERHSTIGRTLSFEDVIGLALSTPPADSSSHTAGGQPKKPSEGLTERELEVLCELTKGKSVREIAASFRITYETMRTHVQRVREKLGVNNRQAAAKRAIDEGWCIAD